MSSDPCGTVTILDPCGVTVVPANICGTAVVSSPCATAAPVSFGIQRVASRFSTVVTDRSIAQPGEVFFVYLLADPSEYLVTDTGLYIIAG